MPSWSPPFAPHVRGDYPEKSCDEDGRLESARVDLRCENCGDESEARCDSGRYRERIARYALAHACCPGKITA